MLLPEEIRMKRNTFGKDSSRNSEWRWMSVTSNVKTPLIQSEKAANVVERELVEDSCMNEKRSRKELGQSSEGRLTSVMNQKKAGKKTCRLQSGKAVKVIRK
jgi:hypothetical protein